MKKAIITIAVVIVVLGGISYLVFGVLGFGKGGIVRPLIDNPLDKSNLIVVTTPIKNSEVSSPLSVAGRVRGNWFFEGSFPLVLTDWDGKIIAEGHASAVGEWMTEDFVKFVGTMEFTKPAYGKNGFLILKKDNPSGLPEHDDALEIPVNFK